MSCDAIKLYVCWRSLSGEKITSVEEDTKMVSVYFCEPRN